MRQRLLVAMAWLTVGGMVVVYGDENPVSVDRLPLQGEWQGTEQCSVLDGGDPTPASPLEIIIRDNEVFNAFGPQGRRSNSMFAHSDQNPGLTSEAPDFVRSLRDAKILSEDGKNLFGMLAEVLEHQPEGISTYVLSPSDSVVRGRMFCNAGEKWCHFQAVKRVKFGGETYEVEGGDLMKDYGGRMVRVGYAYDRVGCAPKVCVYVCEAALESKGR